LDKNPNYNRNEPSVKMMGGFFYGFKTQTIPLPISNRNGFFTGV